MGRRKTQKIIRTTPRNATEGQCPLCKTIGRLYITGRVGRERGKCPACNQSFEVTDIGPASVVATTSDESHLYAIRTTGGQEKIVMNSLEAKAKASQLNVKSILLVDNLRGYVVIEAGDPSAAFQAVDGVRHIRGQLRGELEFKDIEGYLIKKSTVTSLAKDQVVEITGGPFKGMRATITRIEHEKEEATVVLLEAAYQMPVTVDANYLKIAPTV